MGDIGEINAEIKNIIIDNKIVNIFLKKALNELKSIEEKKKKREKRRLHKATTFTIDPDNAKDFDDALSFKILDNNVFEIGVHIADVSSYVKPDTELDKEAERGTSVYLANKVIPMLPKHYPMRYAHLNLKKRKGIFIIFKIDKKGNVKKERAARTIIYSDYRLTYSDVQNIIENDKEGKEHKEIETAIINLNKISKKIRKKKEERGAIFNKKELI